MLVKMYGERGNRVAVTDGRKYGQGYRVEKEVTADGFVVVHSELSMNEAIRKAEEMAR